jgi:prepilin-type N-terminal cleavage/methylation domain-containing protein
MKKIYQIKKGFSLVEVMVAVFIFVSVMLSVVGVFSKFMAGYKNARSVQRNLEDAQAAMNLIAKSIRTSAVESTTTAQPAASYIEIFDYSQTIKCIKYKFSANVIEVTYANGVLDEASCNDAAFGGYNANPLTNKDIADARFAITPTCDGVSGCGAKAVGKVTISMLVCANANCAASNAGKMALQTTVSLRN